MSKSIDITKFHQIKAIQTLDRSMGNIARYYDTELLFGKVPKISKDQLNRIGLMFNDGTGKLFLIRETFKDFFTAQLICEKVFKGDLRSKKELEFVLELYSDVVKFVIITLQCSWISS